MADTVAIPTPNVADGGSIAAPSALQDAAMVHDLSILGMFAQADWVVKSVIIALLLSSFWSWVIIFNKLVVLKFLKSQTSKFERQFWSGELLETLYTKIKKRAVHPMAKVFVSGMYEWQNRREYGHEQHALKIGLKERIFQAMAVTSNKEMDKLEGNLGFLATVGSTAPFVGLFGTVWGIMNSFTAIAKMQNASLNVVAPGIAEALLATAIGLFAAIPAVIFYNKLSNDLARFGNKIDMFSEELGAIISRELDG